MKHRYLNQEDVRDIRNIDELLSDHPNRTRLLSDEHFGKELWMFFRKLRVRLDKGGDKTKAWQRVKPGGRTRKST